VASKRDDVIRDADAEALVKKIDNAPPGLRVPDVAELCGLSEALFCKLRKEKPAIQNAVRRYQRRHPVKRKVTPADVADRKAAAQIRKTVYRLNFSPDDELVDKLEKIEGLPENGHILSVVGCEALAKVAAEALDEIAHLRATRIGLTREVYKVKEALAQKLARTRPQPAGPGQENQYLSDDYLVGFD
jgi:hypothetical protein